MNTPSWTDVAQTIGVLAALLFTAREIRARTKEQKFRNYLDAISGFVDLAGLMVEKPELHGIYEYSKSNIERSYVDLTPEQKARAHYCDAIIALCETIWLADQEGWLSADEWRYWKRWLVELGQSPDFRWALNWVADDYDKEFIKEIRGKAAC